MAVRVRLGSRVFHIPTEGIVFALSLLASLVVLYFGVRAFYGTPHMYTVVLVAVLTFIVPVGAYFYIHYRRVLQMERAFPQFLRDLADAQRAGMTLPQAVVSVAKVNYGPLSDEVRRLANQISWGVPFEDALSRFAQRTGSKMIRASVRLILEAYRAGGDIASILYTVAEDSRKVHSLREERKTKFAGFVATMYAVFLIYLALVAILLNTLIPELPSLPSISGGGIFGVSATPTPQRIEEGELRAILFHLTIIEAIFSGIIAGIAGEGSALAGIRHALIMVFLALFAFQLFIPLPDPVDRLARVIAKAPPNVSTSIYVGRFFVERNITVADVNAAITAYVKGLGFPIFGGARRVDFVQGTCAPCESGDVYVRPDGIFVRRPSYITLTVQPAGGVFHVFVGG